MLAVFLFAAALGTWTHALLLNDGGVILSVGWLGSAWDLYISQIVSRSISILAQVGPAWAARAMFDLDADTYMTLAHVLYFAVPLILWFALRAIERDRLFSRLYLAIALVLAYFPTELVVGIGLWLIWLTLVIDPARSTKGAVLATLLLGAAMAFTHPALALMGLVFVLAGLALPIFGQRLPKRSLVAVGILSALLLAAYFAMNRWLPPTNPTVVADHEVGSYNYINPVWMLKTMGYFPMLAALWFLLLVPGAGAVRLQWRHLPLAIFLVAAFGLWCAVGGTSLKTWTYARNTGPYIMMVALVLALPARAEWLRRAERPLMLFAAIVAVAALSYNVDIFLFGRFIDPDLAPGIVDAATVDAQWPSKIPTSILPRTFFKYAAGENYARDVVMPNYDRFRVTLAFYSYFRTDRQSVLFHRSEKDAEWLPFECPAVGRAIDHSRDARDRQFLNLIARNYCAP